MAVQKGFEPLLSKKRGAHYKTGLTVALYCNEIYEFA